jgi:hypothetical protein
MRSPAVLAFVLSSFLTSAALAQGAAPVASAKAEGVGYFVGRWDVASRDPSGGDVLQVAYTVEQTPGGWWAAGAGASSDGSLQSRDMWGRDPLSGELIRVIFDGSGTYATVRSPGWAGDRLVLEGEARSPNGVVRVRETITRLTAQRFEAVWEAYRDGKWVPYALETVTRRT